MRKFLHDLYTDEGGAWSLGRVGTGISLFMSWVWVTYLIIKNHQLPDLAGLGVYIGVPYAITKTGAVVSSFKSDK